MEGKVILEKRREKIKTYNKVGNLLGGNAELFQNSPLVDIGTAGLGNQLGLLAVEFASSSFLSRFGFLGLFFNRLLAYK